MNQTENRRRFSNSEEVVLELHGGAFVESLLKEGSLMLPGLGLLEIKDLRGKRTAFFRPVKTDELFVADEGSSPLVREIISYLRVGKNVTLPQLGHFRPVKLDNGNFRLSFTASSSLRNVLSEVSQEQELQEQEEVSFSDTTVEQPFHQTESAPSEIEDSKDDFSTTQRLYTEQQSSEEFTETIVTEEVKEAVDGDVPSDRDSAVSDPRFDFDFADEKVNEPEKNEDAFLFDDLAFEDFLDDSDSEIRFDTEERSESFDESEELPEVSAGEEQLSQEIQDITEPAPVDSEEFVEAPVLLSDGNVTDDAREEEEQIVSDANIDRFSEIKKRLVLKREEIKSEKKDSGQPEDSELPELPGQPDARIEDQPVETQPEDAQLIDDQSIGVRSIEAQWEDNEQDSSFGADTPEDQGNSRSSENSNQSAPKIAKVGDVLIPEDDTYGKERMRQKERDRRNRIITTVVLLLILFFVFWIAKQKNQDPASIENMQGDTEYVSLLKLAEEQYGNSVFWVYIYQANKDKLNSPVNIPKGTNVRIPDLGEFNVDVNDTLEIRRARYMADSILKFKR